jgi:hypothetical protein
MKPNDGKTQKEINEERFKSLDEVTQSTITQNTVLADDVLYALCRKAGVQNVLFWEQMAGCDWERVVTPPCSLRGPQLLAMQIDALKRKKWGFNHFDAMLQSSASMSIAPGAVSIMDRMGQSKEIKLPFGIPASVEPIDVSLFRGVTQVMTTSVLERTSETTTEGVMTKGKPVLTDVSGIVYPSFASAQFIPEIAKHYVSGVTMSEVRDNAMKELMTKSTAEKLSVTTQCAYMTAKSLDREMNITHESGWQPYVRNCAGAEELGGPLEEKKLEQLEVEIAKLNSKKVNSAPQVQAATLIRDRMAKKQFFIAQGLRPFVLARAPTVMTPTVNTMDDMWRVLKAWRDIRGANEKSVSPFTHPVYYGMLMGHTKPILHAANIMYIAGVCGATSVWRNDTPYFKSAWSVLELNLPVFRDTALKAFNPAEHTYGTYMMPKDEKDKKKILYIFMASTTSPQPVSKPTKMIQYSPKEAEVVAYIKRMFELRQGRKVVVMCYGSPQIFKEFAGRIGPTLHPHAGDVAVYNFQLPKKIALTQEAFIYRVVTANVWKTYYPFHWKQWSSHDPIASWPLLFVKRQVAKTKNIFFDLDHYENIAKYSNIETFDVDEVQIDAYEKKIDEERLQLAKKQEQLQQAGFDAYEKEVNAVVLNPIAPVQDVADPNVLEQIKTMTTEQVIDMVGGSDDYEEPF